MAENEPAEDAGAPGAPEAQEPKKPDTGYVVPNNRSAVLDALAGRRAQLRDEVAEDQRDDLVGATREDAIASLQSAAGVVDDLENRDDTVGNDEPISSAEESAGDQEEPADDGEPDPPPAPAQATPKKITVMVDGKATEVDEETISRALKQSKAPVETDELRARLDRLESSLTRNPQPDALAGDQPAAGDANAPKGNQGAEAAEPVSSQEVERIQAAIQFGTDADAQAAIADLIKNVSKAAQDQALQTLRGELAMKDRRDDIIKSVKRLEGKFPEVMKDADLRMVAIEKVFAKRAQDLVGLGYKREEIALCMTSSEGRQLIIQKADQEAERGRLESRDKVFTDIVAEVHKKFVPPQSSPRQQNAGRPSGTRRELKRAIAPPLPTASSARAPIIADEPARTRSTSDVINGMRKARGQLVAS